MGNSSSLGLRYVFVVKVPDYQFSFFSHLGFNSGIFFLNTSFPDQSIFLGNSCSLGLRYSWEIAAHSACDMFSKYKYLIVSLVFSRLGFWSGNFFLIAPCPDHCLLVPFYLFKRFVVQTSMNLNCLTNATSPFIASIAFRGKHYDTSNVIGKFACGAFDVSHTKPDFTAIENVKMIKNSNLNLYSLTRNLRR